MQVAWWARQAHAINANRHAGNPPRIETDAAEHGNEAGGSTLLTVNTARVRGSGAPVWRVRPGRCRQPPACTPLLLQQQAPSRSRDAAGRTSGDSAPGAHCSTLITLTVLEYNYITSKSTDIHGVRSMVGVRCHQQPPAISVIGLRVIGRPQLRPSEMYVHVHVPPPRKYHKKRDCKVLLFLLEDPCES